MATLSPEERATVVRGVELLATTELAKPTAAAQPAAHEEREFR
jgi:hypothetical protein